MGYLDYETHYRNCAEPRDEPNPNCCPGNHPEYAPATAKDAVGTVQAYRATEEQPEKFWMVWREGGKRPRFKHTTHEAALIEAKRVAEQHPGFATYVLEATGFYVAPPPVVPAAEFGSLWAPPQRVEKL
jgi:hypothetical protein